MSDRNKARLVAAATAVIGLIAFVVVMSFNRLGPAAYALSEGCMSGDTMVRFELARSLAEAPFLTNGCARPTILGLNAENHFDIAAFIWSYNGFIALAAVFLGRSLRKPLVLAAIGAAMVALVADYVETFTLLKITRSLPDAGPLFATSSTAAWVKFGFIAVNAGLLSAICWMASPRRPILGALLVLPVLATLLLARDVGQSLWVTIAYMASWLPVMLVAAREAIAPPKAA